MAKPYIDSTAAVRKTADVSGGNRIPTKHDKRALSTDTVTNNRIQFFQPDPERNLYRDYRDNPFQGAEPKKIVGIGLYVTPTVIRSDDGNSIDARRILESLEHSAVTLGKGNRRQTTDRMHSTQVADFGSATVKKESYDNSTNNGQIEVVHFDIDPYRVLHDPTLTVEGDERFYYTLHFRDGFELPAMSDWNSSSEPTAYATALVQYERLTG